MLLRHMLKLAVRVPPVNAAILGSAPGHFHGYTLKQALLIVISPTVFGILLAIKSKRGLLLCGITNVCFMAAAAYLAPNAFIYSETLRNSFYEEINADPWGQIFAIGAPLSFVTPFVVNEILRSRTILRYWSDVKRLPCRVLMGHADTWRSPVTPDAVEISISRFRIVVTWLAGLAAVLTCWQLHVLHRSFSLDDTASSNTLILVKPWNPEP